MLKVFEVDQDKMRLYYTYMRNVMNLIDKITCFKTDIEISKVI